MQVLVGLCLISIIIGITTFFGLQVSRLGLLCHLIYLKPKNLTSDRTDIDIMINLTSQSAYCFEYFTLFHGIMLFSYYYFSEAGQDLLIWKTMHKRLCSCYQWWEDVLECPKFDNREDHDTGNRSGCNVMCCHKCVHKALLIMVTFLIITSIELLHLSISMMPPLFLISWKEDNIIFYNTDSEQATGYAALAFFDHFYNFVTRSVMAFITIFVISAWKKARDNLKTNITEKFEDKLENKKVDTIRQLKFTSKLNEEELGSILTTLVDEYHTTGRRVNAVQNIFQGWFVIKWIVYFIDITGHSLLAAEILFNNKGEYKVHELSFTLTHLAYDFFAFFFLFVCGSWMNHSHTKYRKAQAELQKKCLQQAPNSNTLIMQGLDTLISEVPEYQFLPTVFWIDFPLNSPGYTLTMLLALFAFIANFLTKYSSP